MRGSVPHLPVKGQVLSSLARTKACWIAGCIAAVSSLHGCFYVKPIPPPVFNDPPEIRNPATNPVSVRVSGNRVTLQVTASDPEGETIYFEWFDLEDVEVIDDDVFPHGALWTSRVTIVDATPLRDDPSVRVLVHDGHYNNEASVIFNLVFP